ncbi:MAG: glycosyltransferase [Solirubrobacteraceae bacterium]
MPARTDARPHLLTITDIIGQGGAESLAVELCVRADPERFRRSLCLTRPIDHLPGSDASRQRLLDAGVQVLRLDRGSTGDLAAVRRLGSLIRTQGVDLIHAHKFGSNVWAASLGALMRVPVRIAHEHTWSFQGQHLRRLIDRQVVARWCDVVIAVSEADRSQMVSTVGMRADRVIVVPNGIAWSGTGRPGKVRHELGIGPSVPVLVITAVLRPQKALPVMLAAHEIIRRSHPDAHLIVAGHGDQSELRAEAARLGIDTAVSFLGSRADMEDVLASADVAVLSSDYEGMPLAVLEYMAAGLPVVATQVGGVPEVVLEGETGFLVAPRDPAALAEKVRLLLDDRARARQMGERGRSRQRERFSQAAMVDQIVGLYCELLAARGITVPSRPPPRAPGAADEPA